MRVNLRVFEERLDMLNGIRIPNCPTQFRVIAENIMDMVTKVGYSVGNYNTMTELDKILTLGYWREYDGLTTSPPSDFDAWFLHKATQPDILQRAIRFLVSHNYLLIKPEVQQRALEASRKFSQAFGR